MKKIILIAIVALGFSVSAVHADPGHGSSGQGGSDTGMLPGGSNGSTPAAAGGSNGRSGC